MNISLSSLTAETMICLLKHVRGRIVARWQMRCYLEQVHVNVHGAGKMVIASMDFSAHVSPLSS